MNSPPRVWVVDDHRGTADAVAKIARGLGCDAEAFGAGEVARDALDRDRATGQAPCDLLVTDLRMPGMGGLALIRLLRARVPTAVMVIITAYGTAEEYALASQLGVHSVLTKPISIEAVEAVLTSAIAAARRH